MGYQKRTSHAKTCYFLILCSSSGLAQNSTQLREILSKNTTDILLLDIHFGEENKLELSKKIKRKMQWYQNCYSYRRQYRKNNTKCNFIQSGCFCYKTIFAAAYYNLADFVKIFTFCAVINSIWCWLLTVGRQFSQKNIRLPTVRGISTVFWNTYNKFYNTRQQKKQHVVSFPWTEQTTCRIIYLTIYIENCNKYFL